jgi:hypothetical protein
MSLRNQTRTTVITTATACRVLPVPSDRKSAGYRRSKRWLTLKALGKKAKAGETWSEWQDLNLRPPASRTLLPVRSYQQNQRYLNSVDYHYRRLFTGFRWSIGGWDSPLRWQTAWGPISSRPRCLGHSAGCLFDQRLAQERAQRAADPIVASHWISSTEAYQTKKLSSRRLERVPPMQPLVPC